MDLAYGDYQIYSHPNSRMWFDDWRYTPNQILPKLKYSDVFTKIIMGLSFCHLVIALFECIVYNCKGIKQAKCRAAKPTQNDSQINPSNSKNMEPLSNKQSNELVEQNLLKEEQSNMLLRLRLVEWHCLLVIISFILLYIVFVLEWNILGAILNPTAYLTYASCAGTLIAFITVKYRQLIQQVEMGLAEIAKFLQKDDKENVKQFSVDYFKQDAK